jgi:hypothetical protein
MRRLASLLFIMCILLASGYSIPAVAGGEFISAAWNGSTWAVLYSDSNGYTLILYSHGKVVRERPIESNAIPCYVSWNGSEWILEAFAPDTDRAILELPNGSEITFFHSYGCSGFAFWNGTYYIPLMESAMMGDCSLGVVREGNVSWEDCGAFDGFKIKTIGGGLYALFNFTRIMEFQNGSWREVFRVENPPRDFSFLHENPVFCPSEILPDCTAVECNSTSCLMLAGPSVYEYTGNRLTNITSIILREPHGSWALQIGLFLIILLILWFLLAVWKMVRRKF